METQLYPRVAWEDGRYRIVLRLMHVDENDRIDVVIEERSGTDSMNNPVWTLQTHSKNSVALEAIARALVVAVGESLELPEVTP